MADIFNYSVATNTGKGFITHADRRKFWLRGYPANVWVATDGQESRLWVARNNGTTKTKDEAQALVTAETESMQATFDALSAEEKEMSIRPETITLP
jgi:hypothetical protein